MNMIKYAVKEKGEIRKRKSEEKGKWNKGKENIGLENSLIVFRKFSLGKVF